METENPKEEPECPFCGRRHPISRCRRSSDEIEAVRRILPQCWFHENKCSAGLEALAAYHEKRDEKRALGLGPAHDWSSHGADAFGLMAIAYDEPSAQRRFQINYPRSGYA